MTAERSAPDIPRASGAYLVPSRPRNAAVRYGASAVAWLAASALTLLLTPVLTRASFVFFWLAVLFAAWFAGFRAALAAAVGAVLVVNWRLIPPLGTFAWPELVDLLTLVIFCLAAGLVSALAARAAAARRRVEEQARELAARADLLEQQQVRLEEQTVEAEALAEEANAASAELAEANTALAESESRWRTLADSAPVLIWTAGATGAREWVNQPWLAFTGRTLAQERGDGWLEAVHPEDRARCAQVCRAAVAERRPFSMDYRLRRHDGAYRWVQESGAPRTAPDGGFLGFVGSCTDVSDRYAAQAEQERARLAAEDANRAKTQFLTSMSHELRTPINAALGYTDLLLLGVDSPVTDGQREMLERIRRSQQRLLGRVNDVLNFARLESGQVSYHVADVPVAEALASVEPLVAPQLAAKGLHYTLRPGDPGLLVRADGERLEQILLNLLSNAIKFTPAGGSIALEAEASGEVVEIRVRDSGRGIPPAKLESIFEPFVQVDQGLTRSSEGAGLGLAICRGIARGMNGDVRASSVPGEGSVFTLTLPRGGGVAGGRLRSPQDVAEHVE